MLLKTSFDGELEVDHRASPGLPESVARRWNYDPLLTREGKVYRARTLGCPHCGAVVAINPQRQSERAHCQKCARYICDWCKAAMNEPDYVHITMAEIIEKVRSGKYMVVGSMHKPKLVEL